MRQLLGFIALCVLVTGCVHHFDAATNELLAAIDQAPLPPGNEWFMFEPDDTPTSYMVRAEYQGKTVKEIEDFYHAYFRENGWEKEFPDETETSGFLSYKKGRATYLITIFGGWSLIQLAVIYREYEFTWEEFDVLIGESANAEAVEVVEKIANTYSALETYRDTGHHESIDDGELLTEADFETRFIANGRF